MIIRWKTINILIGLCAFTTIHAGALLSIVPASTSIIVTDSATATITWTVTNNTSKPTSIFLKALNSSGGVPANSTTGLGNGGGCANSRVAPNHSCSFTMTINGGALSTSTFIVSPTFCGFKGQACSQPAINNRLTINHQFIPNPNGSWSTYSFIPNGLLPNNTLSYPEFVSMTNTQIAVGGIDANIDPSVLLCPTTLNNIAECTQSPSGPQTFDAITQLDYDKHGHLYSIFTAYTGDFINPYQSTILKLPSGSSSWETFNTRPINGVMFGLDTHSPWGILASSAFNVAVPGFGLVSFGSAWTYRLNGEGDNKTNVLSSGLSEIIDDGDEHVYVAGAVSNYSITPTPETYSMIWRAEKGTSNFIAINMPTNIPTITAMVSNGHGTIYISGTDDKTDGHVWSYNEKDGFKDTGLIADDVAALEFSPYGYLLAGGTVNFNVGAVWYYSAGKWTSLSIPQSTKITSITGNSNNQIVAIGQNNDFPRAPTMWLYQ